MEAKHLDIWTTNCIESRRKNELKILKPVLEYTPHGTIIDHKNRLEIKEKISFFVFSYEGATECVEKLNADPKEKRADWRLPDKKEARAFDNGIYFCANDELLDTSDVNRDGNLCGGGYVKPVRDI